ncbi:MAG: AAA family ATPase [Planctomycetota bacterium]
MSKVLELTAHNVLGVKDIRFDLDGHHLFLIGGSNYQGKTSALQALLMCLCGKKGMEGYPEVALRDGEKKGVVQCVIEGDEEVFGTDNGGPMTAELRWRRKASGKVEETFRLLDESGEEAPTPRTLLQKMFALKAFDPLSFARMKPADQARTVQELLGVDLESFDAERKRVFEERREIGVEAKRLAGHFDSLSFDKSAPAKEESVSDMMSSMEELTAKSEMRSKLERARSVHLDSVAELKSENQRLADQITEIKRKMGENQKTIEETEVSITKAEETLANDPNYADVSDDMTSLRERIKTADETNAKIRSNAEYKRVQVELKAVREQYDAKSERLKEIDEAKSEAIAQAPWPVEGMELQEDGLLLDGLPFAQASTAQRIMASTKIGMALNPKLRLLVCEHGSDLDSETLDSLEQAAKDNDFQILVELVTRTSEDEERCAVIIKDGEVEGDTESDE